MKTRQLLHLLLTSTAIGGAIVLPATAQTPSAPTAQTPAAPTTPAGGGVFLCSTATAMVSYIAAIIFQTIKPAACCLINSN